MLPRVHARKNTLNQDGDADTALKCKIEAVKKPLERGVL
jgi:hypothetical protein